MFIINEPRMTKIQKNFLYNIQSTTKSRFLATTEDGRVSSAGDYMKKTYKIEERRYGDGSARFYPKVHDWWHGWRYYSDWKVRDWVEPPGRICFGTLDEAREWIGWQIKSDRGCEKART